MDTQHLTPTSTPPQGQQSGTSTPPQGQHGPAPWLDLADGHARLRWAAWQHLALSLPYLLAGAAVGWCWYEGLAFVPVHSATSGAIVGAATALALWMLRMPRVACVLVLLVGVLAVI